MQVQGERSDKVTERVFVACDVANMWKSCREQFGQKARVDFQVLKEIVPAIRDKTPVWQTLCAYIVTSPRGDHHNFEAVLKSLGYCVRERCMRFAKGDDGPLRSDWDVGITIDAIDKIDTYDTFVLVSGDGDFSYLLEYLKGKGKTTVVLTFEQNTSRLLYDSADELHFLTSRILYNATAQCSSP